MNKSLLYQDTGSESNYGFDYDSTITRKLLEKPTESVKGSIGGNACVFKIISPNYIELISQHYDKQLLHSIDYYHDQLNIPVLFPNFGLSIDFNEATELNLHDEDMTLPDEVKDLLRNFGAVIFRNVHLASNVRDMGHRNRFPQLNFHVDRVQKQVSYYSVYTRNPFDEEQKYPRTSSTLFIPVLVAYLQGLSEGRDNIISEEGLIKHAVLYNEDSIEEILNTIIVEHAWDMPEGTGEISIINNCNVLHASYYPNIYNKGYRIGVRYLS